MHTLSLRALRGAACLAVAVSAFATVHAKTLVTPTVVRVRHLKPVSTEVMKPVHAQAMPLSTRRAMPAASQPHTATVDADGSRFRYDSCGCSGD